MTFNSLLFHFGVIMMRDSTKASMTSKMSKILFVEDCEATKAAVKDFFASKGIQVVCVSSGPAAVRIIKSGETFDALLMDLSFPVGTPEEVVAAANSLAVKIPIGVCSGSFDIVRRVDKLGVTTFIRKPYKIESLAAMAESLISQEVSGREVCSF